MAWPKGMKRPPRNGVASGKTTKENNVKPEGPSTESWPSPSTTSTFVMDTEPKEILTKNPSSPIGAENTTSLFSTPTREVISESLIGYVRNAYPEITSAELAKLSPLAQAKLSELSKARSEPFNETIKQIANFYFGSGSGWCERSLAAALNFYLEEQF